MASFMVTLGKCELTFLGQEKYENTKHKTRRDKMESIWSSCIKVVQSVMEVDLPEDVSARFGIEIILT